MTLNGCHNREPYTPITRVQDGYSSRRGNPVMRMVNVPFRMNPECQYTYTELGKADKGCDGCKWRVME